LYIRSLRFGFITLGHFELGIEPHPARASASLELLVVEPLSLFVDLRAWGLRLIFVLPTSNFGHGRQPGRGRRVGALRPKPLQRRVWNLAP
jgi:hypothetical protein